VEIKEDEMKWYARNLKAFTLATMIVGLALCLNTGAVFSQEQDIAEGTSISVAQLRSVQQVQRNNEAQLFSIPGVIAVGIGLGERGDDLALHVYLNVSAPSASHAAIPQHADSVPVRIIETDEIVPQDGPPGNNHKLQYNLPVPMGVSTGNDNACYSGTLGVRAFRNGQSSRVGYITNSHVASAGSNLCPGLAAFSEDQFQRGRLDNGCSLTGLKKIGDLIQHVPLVFGNAFENTVDAAFVLSSRSLVSKTILDIGNPSPSILAPALNMAVQKSGRTTGFTRGTITSINVTVTINYNAATTCPGGGFAKFVNQMAITGSAGAFSAGGDSGSLILSTTRDSSSRFRPVGLLFAGSSTTTFANRISDVLGALSAAIDTL
jgi:hypothetical protein